MKTFEDIVQTTLERHIRAIAGPQARTPPSPYNGECVPQRTGNNDPKNIDLVVFLRQDGSYPRVTWALEGDCDDLIDAKRTVLLGAGYTLSIRFEWPGYQSATYQIRAKDWCHCANPNKPSLSKVAHEVTKIVQKFSQEMATVQIDAAHRRWRLGTDQHAVRLEDLRMAAFEQVSAGSWQVRLFHSPRF